MRVAKVFSPIDAAFRLGITPELLFAYASNPPKASLGDSRTLSFRDDDDGGGFLAEDLDAFDQYLSEPWALAGSSRPGIPSYVRDYLKVECNGQCPKCGSGLRLEDAHIDPWSESLSHHHHNLIRLCVLCHKKFDTKNLVDRDNMRSLKQRLIADLRSRLRRPLDIVRAWSQMPNASRCFVGRDGEVSELVSRLAKDRSLCVHGVAGIGKTQLVINALHRSSDVRPVLWLNLESLRSLEDVVSALASALPHLPPTLDRRVVLHALSVINIRVVLDGIERLSNTDTDDLIDFISDLVAYTRLPQIIITSQFELTELELDSNLALSTLEDVNSDFVLRSALRGNGERDCCDDSISWLVSFCEGHPLTLSITSGLLKHFRTAEKVVAKIKVRGADCIQSPTRNRQTVKTSLQLCLQVAFEALETPCRAILWVVSNCPAGIPEEFFGHTGIKQQIPDFVSAVAALQRWHLIHVMEGSFPANRIYALSPIRAFSANAAKADARIDLKTLCYEFVCTQAIHIGVLDINRMQAGDTAYGVFRFDQEFPNFLSAFELAIDRCEADDRLLQFIGPMSTSLMPYCFVRGFFTRGAAMLNNGVDASLKLGKPSSASTALSQLIALGVRMSNTKLIFSATDRLIQLARETGEQQIAADAEVASGERLLIEVELNVGSAEGWQSKLRNAKNHFEKAVQLFETLKTDCRSEDNDEADWINHRIAIAYKQSGFACEMLGETANAICFYEKAIILIEGQKDQINAGSVYHALGNCSAHTGENDKAASAYLRAASLFAAIGSAEYLSNSLSELGYLLAKWTPRENIDALFDKSLLDAGLSDTLLQIQESFREPDVHPARVNRIVRKVFGMISLCSFTSKNSLLYSWANTIRNEIVATFAPQLHVNDPTEFLIAYLDLTSSLAGSLSAISQPNGIGFVIEARELEHYGRLCIRLREWFKMSFDVFDWLAIYVTRHRQLANVTAPDLLAEIEAIEESGESLDFERLFLKFDME